MRFFSFVNKNELIHKNNIIEMGECMGGVRGHLCVAHKNLFAVPLIIMYNTHMTSTVCVCVCVSCINCACYQVFFIYICTQVIKSKKIMLNQPQMNQLQKYSGPLKHNFC